MQAIKSVLVHMDSSAHATKRIQVARQVAETFGAEVTVQYCVTPALLRFATSLDESGQAVAIMEELDQERRAKAHRLYEALGAQSPQMRWGERLGNEPWGFVQRAFYTDLLVLGQRDPDDAAADDLPPDFLPDLLVGTGRPALVLPYAGPAARVGDTVLIAWKETREAARAVAAALPWLARARQVHALAYGDDAGRSLASLARYLGRHGVITNVHAAGPEHGEVGENLLSRAADLGADLLVMGCYGHSRAREFVLGGMTRTLLQSMTLPVLMVH